MLTIWEVLLLKAGVSLYLRADRQETKTGAGMEHAGSAPSETKGRRNSALPPLVPCAVSYGRLSI